MSSAQHLFLAACVATDLQDYLHSLSGEGLFTLQAYLSGNFSDTSITGQMLGQVMLEAATRYFKEVQP
jgi:cytochrome c oxidase assembly protein Cox11